MAAKHTDTEQHQEEQERDLAGAAPPRPAAPASAAPLAASEGEAPLRRLNRLQATAEVIIAIAVVLTVCYVAKLILAVLLVSILLAFILAPLVDLFARLRLPRALGSALAVLVLLAAVFGVTYVSYNRASDFVVQELPRYSGKIRDVITKIRQHAQKFQETTQKVIPQEPPQKGTVQVQQPTNWLLYLLTRSLGPATEITFAALFIPFLVYFMLSWQEHVRAASVMLFRLEHRNAAYVTLGLMSAMIRSYIVGNVLVGLFIGVVSTAVFGFLHLNYFYFIGFISGFLSLVPYLGVILACLPPLIAGLGHLHSTGVIVIVLAELGLHLFALNVLYPKFIGRRLELNPLAVTLALLFWGWLWGAMGLILAIPITAGVKIVLDHVESLRPYGRWLGE